MKLETAQGVMVGLAIVALLAVIFDSISVRLRYGPAATATLEAARACVNTAQRDSELQNCRRFFEPH